MNASISIAPGAATASDQRVFKKPALSTGDLLAHLRARGLSIPDIDAAVDAINTIGYYRLLIYMRPLQIAISQTGIRIFRADTSFTDILLLYNFDRELRLLVLDAVERIEVALRAAIVNELAVTHGPHFYLDPKHYYSHEKFARFVARATKTRCVPIDHYRITYRTPPEPPIWAITEGLSFGQLSHLFGILTRAEQHRVANAFSKMGKLSPTILQSWFRTSTTLRNLCAHQTRIWNANLIVDAPRRARIVNAELFRTDTFYARAVVLSALLGSISFAFKVAWQRRLTELLDRYPNVRPVAMGFPSGWQSRPPWTNASILDEESDSTIIAHEALKPAS